MLRGGKGLVGAAGGEVRPHLPRNALQWANGVDPNLSTLATSRSNPSILPAKKWIIALIPFHGGFGQPRLREIMREVEERVPTVKLKVRRSRHNAGSDIRIEAPHQATLLGWEWGRHHKLRVALIRLVTKRNRVLGRHRVCKSLI